jgi:hypothetical protein
MVEVPGIEPFIAQFRVTWMSETRRTGEGIRSTWAPLRKIEDSR